MAALIQDYSTVSASNHHSSAEISTTDALANLEIRNAKEQSRLTALPSEIHLKIFDLLDDDPESSTCLGLTCQKLYPLFFARHPKPRLFRMCPECESLKRKAFADKDPKNIYTNCESCKNVDTSGLQLFVLLEQWMQPHWEFSAYRTKFLTSRKVEAIRRGVCDNYGVNETCSARGLMRFDGYGCASCTATLENKFFGAVWVRIHSRADKNPRGLGYRGIVPKTRGYHHGRYPTNERNTQHQYQFSSNASWGWAIQSLYK